MELWRGSACVILGLAKVSSHAGAIFSGQEISCAGGSLSLLPRVGTFRLVPSFSQHFGAPRPIP